MTFQSFPSIEQFRNVIRTVSERTAFVGKDENDEPIYDGLKPKPTLRFRGTVKIHGTNAGITFVDDGKGWFNALAQSRSSVLVAPDDNAGFRAWVDKLSPETLECLFADARMAIGGPAIDLSVAPITVFGEWAGKGIQKGVAVSQVEKFFYVFAVKQGDVWGDLTGRELFKMGSQRIYNAPDVWVRDINVDFEHPELVQNELGEITTRIEALCPVGKFLGVEGIGEGVVWECTSMDPKYAGLRFKVKGEKHSVSHVKTLAAVDVERVKTVQEFVDKVLPEPRLQQGLDKLREMGKPLDMTSTGDFLRWIVGDVLKEESDTMVASGIDPKEVGKVLNQQARRWFMTKVAGA